MKAARRVTANAGANVDCHAAEVKSCQMDAAQKASPASSIEDSLLKQDKTITCSTFSKQSETHTDVSSRFGFVQYVGVTRWIFTDENNAEVRSLVSSRYPLLNLMTSFLPDLPGQLPSRNHNRIISATEKTLPKAVSMVRTIKNKLCATQTRKKQMPTRSQGRKGSFTRLQAYCTFVPSHVKQYFSVLVYSFAAESWDQQTRLREGPTYLCSLRKRMQCSSLPG